MKTKQYRTGLVLSGGGARAFAHFGAMYALNERGIYPDIISGSSAGALMGAFIADGDNLQDFMRHAKDPEFVKLAKRVISPSEAHGEASVYLRELISKFLRATTFEELKIPLCITVTDFDKGTSKFFESGDLIEPLVASCSVPIFFNPVNIGGVRYVDGGINMNFPVTPIRERCERIIGVNLFPAFSHKDDPSKFLSAADRKIVNIFEMDISKDRELCDIFIEPENIQRYSMFTASDLNDLMELGYRSVIDCKGL